MFDTEHIPTRRLGRTEEQVSILGLGGAHIGSQEITDDEAVRIMRTAVDSGVTFFDNNWAYGDGCSEERMGMALADGYRDRVFLMTKVDARDRKGALEQLDESLRRLRTDHVDLWQIHEVVYENDPEMLSAPGGALEALDEARQAGKTRFVGFTGHKSPGIHLRMLELYPFDTCQMPINVMDAHFMSFREYVVPACEQLDVGVIGMKSLGGSDILKSGVVTKWEALGYALSQPVSTLVTGMDSMEILQENVEIARGFLPLADEEIHAMLAKTAPTDVSGGGRYELYKTSMRFDAEFGRKTHGFPGLDQLAA